MFTAASYNIKCGQDTDFDFTPIGCDLQAVKADIAGIQEVDRLTKRNKNTDTMPVLCEKAALHYHSFAAAMPYKGGHYGIGCLSRFEILTSYTEALPGGAGLEPRVFMSSKVDIGGKQLCFVNTHLSYENTDIQKKQMEALGCYLRALNIPFVLTGDFNTEDFNLFDKLAVPVKLMNNPDSRFPSFYPGNSAIDNIVISDGLRFIKTGMYTDSQNSDHYMIYAQIEFEE